MAKKPIFKTLWAERGVKEEVDSSKIAVGWTAERPPFQWENWSQWRQDAFISHINEKGLPEWDDFTAYGTSGKSYVLGSDGEVYVSTAPSGGTYPASDPSEATTTKWKKAWLDSDGTIGIPRVVGLVAALDDKVDKVAGKALSANDFTNAYKGKLDGIESNAQRNVATNLSNKRAVSSVTLVSSTGEETVIPTASATLAGVLSGTDKAKLDSLPSGVDGIVPLRGGGTGSSNAAGARLALQLGNHSTHNYGTTANTVMMGNDPRVVEIPQQIVDGLAGKADKTTSVSAGNGLSGGGNLSANRSLAVVYGTSVSTSVEGNDPRVVNAASRTELSSGLALKADKSVNIGAGVGLVGGGNLTTNRSFAVNFGSVAGTAAQGNDSRINNGQTAFGWGNHASAGYIKSYVNTTYTAGTGATLTGTTFSVNYGTTAGTAAQGNDSRIVNSVQTSGNQTITGIKTFSSFPVTPSAAPATDYQAANKKYVDDNSIGVGQTWQDVTESRIMGTAYTNTTGRTITVMWHTGGNNRDIVIDGCSVGTWQEAGAFTAVVPNGKTYSCGNNFSSWYELR